jgi:DNA topoisomerase-1
MREKNIVGKCAKCGQGEMIIRHSGRGKRFLGCTRYPECDHTQPLPQRGLILTTEDRCDRCQNPIIKVIMRGRPPWVLCVNMECPKKAEKAAAKAAREKEKKAAARKAARKKAAKAAKAAKAPAKTVARRRAAPAPVPEIVPEPMPDVTLPKPS